jgi:intraflagellar transport protein 74
MSCFPLLTQLNNLEKKWSHLEQNNFAIEEFVANKKAEMNFELVKNKVLKMQWAYNRMLIENVKNLTTAPSTAY